MLDNSLTINGKAHRKWGGGGEGWGNLKKKKSLKLIP